VRQNGSCDVGPNSKHNFDSSHSTPSTCSQFHQHFTYKFFVRTSFQQLFYVHVTREKLLKQRLYEKFVCKMLMKLTTDTSILNVINVVFRLLYFFQSMSKQSILHIKAILSLKRINNESLTT